jgi:hypothetical protein
VRAVFDEGENWGVGDREKGRRGDEEVGRWGDEKNGCAVEESDDTAVEVLTRVSSVMPQEA